MIPLPVILVEFMVAIGLALFLGSAVALLRLRRDDNWPPSRPVTEGAPAPSRVRILGGMTVGLVMTLWAVATFVTKDYSF